MVLCLLVVETLEPDRLPRQGVPRTRPPLSPCRSRAEEASRWLLSLSGLVFSKQFLLTLVVGVTFGFSFAYMLLGAGPIFFALNVTFSLHATLNSRSRSKGTLPRPSLSCGHLGPSRSPGLM